MKRSWWYYFSPCIITAIVLVITIIAGFVSLEETEGWIYITIMVFVPALFMLLLADFIVKALTYGNVKSIWRVEIVVVTILIICYAYSLYF
jgi:hypothetical protein